MRRLLLLFALAGAMWAQPGPNGGMRACSTTPPTKGHAQSCYDTAGAIWTCVGTCTTSGQWVAAAGSGSFVQLSGDATSTASGGATTVSKFNGGTAFGSAASHASTDFQAVLANYSTISGLTGYPATFPPTTTGLVLLGAANTFTTGLQDFSTTTLKIPSGAGFTATASSMFGFDSTAGKPHIWYSAADQAFGTNAFNSTAFVQVATDIGNTAALPHVIGLTGVPFCTGFTPTNGQAIEYSTGGSPNPCWTAATPSGSGILTMATGAGAPVSSCTAPSSSNLAAYTDTINQDLWICAATNTWKKVLSTTNSGAYVVTGLEGTAPATPASTYQSCYLDSTSHTQICINSSAAKSGTAYAITNVSHQWLNSFDPTTGLFTQTQPAMGDVSGTAALSQGGTGAVTAAAALINLFPTATRAGDVIYCATFAAGACTSWALVAGNNSGVHWLQETAAGVASWTSPAGSIAATGNTLIGDGAGNAIAAAGTASNCMHVDGSNAACPGGGATIPSVSTLIKGDGAGNGATATGADVSAITYVAGGGTAQAQTATYSPAIGALVDGLRLCWKPTAANTAAAPTFSPLAGGASAHTIVKIPNAAALVANDLITTAISCATYDSTGTQWELQNPQTASGGGTPGGSTTQMQYNAAGSFGGTPDHTFDGSHTETLGAAGIIDVHAGSFNNSISALVTPTDWIGTAAGAGSKSWFASSIAIPGAAGSGTLDGVHHGIEIPVIYDMTGTNSPTVTMELRACLTSNYTYSNKTTDPCSTGSVVLWASKPDTIPNMSAGTNSDLVYFGVFATAGGTAGHLIVSRSNPKFLPAQFSGTTPNSTSLITCGATCTGGAWTIYQTALWSGSNAAGSATCGGGSSEGTNCVAITGMASKIIY